MKFDRKTLLKGFALGVTSGIFIDIGIGVGIGTRLTSPYNTWLSQGMDLMATRRYAEIQFDSASAPIGLRAQKEYLKHLDRAEANQSLWNTWSVPWMTIELLRFERAITFARIALLEEKTANPQEANLNWTKAEEQAELAQWKNPSRDFLRRTIKRYETVKSNGNSKE